MGVIKMVNWSEFNPIEKVFDPYFVHSGEGETMDSQAVIAISKLVYKWYNDGDVYDNRYGLEGWCNDLSTYANWLYNHCDCDELLGIKDISSDSKYEELLFRLASKFTPEVLEKLDKEEKISSIYEEEGPFEFVEYEEDDWDDEDW